MWLSAIKLAVSAGSKIYANKQKSKMAMSDAQLMHASRMARGEGSLPRKTFRSTSIRLEGRGVLIILSAPMQFWPGQSVSDDPSAMDKVKIFFEHFAALPTGLQICGSLSLRAFMV